MMAIPTGAVKFRVSQTRIVEGRILEEGDKLVLYSPYNLYLKDEFKAMQGARWLGHSDNPDEIPRKAWGVTNSERNRFQLAYLMDLNPYAVYDGDVTEFVSRRRKPDGTSTLYDHQSEIAAHVRQRRHCIVAGEMGVGKTLAAIEVIEAERFAEEQCLWIGPRSALDSVKYEFSRWRLCEICGKLGMHHRYEDHKLVDTRQILPRFDTYEGLKKIIETWPSGSAAFKCVIMDECSRVKTWTAQRTQAAAHLANSMRTEHDRKCIICLMSGTPAPKDPGDWWSLCEIVRPGFLREGTPEKFRRRLGLIKQYEGAGGGSFPKLITWWDNEDKCQECGKFENEPEHEFINMTEKWYHAYRKSINEVYKLYERMKGLVIVKLKKDCLQLPEKIYKRIICKPTPSILRAASLIMKTASSTIKGLTLVRELSDGFQYKEVELGTEKCPTCKGRLKITQTIDLDDPNNPLDSESLTRGHRALWEDMDGEGRYVIVGYKEEPLRLNEQEIDCDQCKGRGVVPHYVRQSTRVDCPKDQAVMNLLDQYEDEGRTVFWAGFTDSVERVTQLCIRQGWVAVRLDGRGWWSNDPILMASSGPDILEAFDDKIRFGKIAFVGQPGAGGMGLNLTASSMEAYYSNTHKGEDRDQSEARIHRPGADMNRGCTIYDLLHLPQDLVVLDSIMKKRDLQMMTLGQLVEATRHYEEEFQRAV